MYAVLGGNSDNVHARRRALSGQTSVVTEMEATKAGGYVGSPRMAGREYMRTSDPGNETDEGLHARPIATSAITPPDTNTELKFPDMRIAAVFWRQLGFLARSQGIFSI